MAKIIFSGGSSLVVPGVSASTLTQELTSQLGVIFTGWSELQTDNGTIYVNPGQIAYVNDDS